MIGKDETLPFGIEEEREKLKSMYSHRPEMLMEFLKECHVFGTLKSEEQVILRNYAISKLEQMGLLDELKLEKALVAMLDEKNVMDGQPTGEFDPYRIDITYKG